MTGRDRVAALLAERDAALSAVRRTDGRRGMYSTEQARLRAEVTGIRDALAALDGAPAAPPAAAGPTRHNHDGGAALPFGRLMAAGQCPRCDELRAGAPARRPDWTDRLGSTARRETADRADRERHFAPGGPHYTGRCGPVCTAFDW